jgi:hypothetical protein
LSTVIYRITADLVVLAINALKVAIGKEDVAYAFIA